MRTKFFENTKRDISTLGLGCMRFPTKEVDGKKSIDFAGAQEIVDYAYSHGVNYFDTAYMYHDGESELVIGECLKKYPRESFMLADKLPLWLVNEKDDVEKIFNDQLKKCQTEYFDFYLMHAMDGNRFKIAKEYGVYDYLCKMREAGKIKNIGFSFHGKVEDLKEMMSTYKWDFVQLQLNYLDWELQNAEEQYKVVTEAGAAVIVMEPVRGGALASLCPESDEIFKTAEPDMSVASWAIRYCATLDNVLVILSGMTTMDQVKDNVATLSDFKALTDEDQAVVAKALQTYKDKNTIPCTACRYCMPCPMGVDIPGMFKMYNDCAVTRNKGGFKNSYVATEESARPDSCIACGKCVKVCPQSIDIPARLLDVKNFAADALK